MDRFLLPTLKESSKLRIHVVFNCQTSSISLKSLEKDRRDKAKTKASTKNKYLPFVKITGEEEVPDYPWKDFLADHQNKKCLVNFLAKKLLFLTKAHLQEDQYIITAGGHVDGKSLLINKSISTPTEATTLKCNHQEAETMIWLHVNKIQQKRNPCYVS